MMRLLSGSLKGRRLPPHDSWVRPTSAYRRHMIFNRLRHGEGFASFEACRVIDVFAGTGALGLEALSQGADHVTLIEKDPRTHKKLATFLAHTLRDRPEAPRVQLHKAAVPFLPPAPHAVDICFLDAPYHQNLIPPALKALAEKGWLKPNTLCVAETDKHETLTPPPWISVSETRQKGSTIVHFWRVETAPHEGARSL
jgi:16S rRNA (guanine966-N2)-methyltransferase